MLVIDSVKLTEFYQPHQMWEFKRYYPLRLKRNAKSQSEIIYIRYMCINIVANYKVRCAPLARQPVSHCLAKKFPDHRDAYGFGRRCCTSRRLNTKTGDARSQEIL